MDRVNLSLKRAEQALKSLQDVLQISDASEIERDAAIQRFEFTFEAV
ncbi:nucleotidyltransferase substrate binding protein [Ferroacidibacillus organovorans]